MSWFPSLFLILAEEIWQALSCCSHQSMLYEQACIVYELLGWLWRVLMHHECAFAWDPVTMRCGVAWFTHQGEQLECQYKALESFLFVVNCKLALTKSIANDWTTKASAICLYGDWTPCCYSCWPSATPEGVQGGVRPSVLQGIWWDRSLDSWMFSGTDFMI